MTIHSTQHAQYIGRVGALAVALGVGVALATGQGMGVAHADASGPTKSSGTSPSVDTKTSAVHSDTDRPAHQRKPKMTLNASGQAVLATPSHDATEPKTNVATPAMKEIRPQHLSHSEPTPDVAPTVSGGVASQAIAVAQPTERALAALAASATQAAPHETQAGALHPTVAAAGLPLVGLPAAIVRFANDVVTELASFVSPPPGTPAPPPPTLLAVPSWVRREFQTVFFNRSPQVAGSNSISLQLNSQTDAGTIDLNTLAHDPDGDVLTYSVPDRGLPGGPANGTVTMDNATGILTYAPDDVTSGARTDTFVVTVSDANSPAHIDGFPGLLNPAAGQTVSTTVHLTIANDPPVANSDTYTATEDAPLTVTAAQGVLANDTDPDGDTITVASHTTPTKGTVAVGANGSFTYTPNANANGTDTFTYLASDGISDSAPATVTINIAPVNDAPVAVNDAVTTAEDTPTTVNVLANDTDADGDMLSVAAVTQGAHGGVALSGNTVTYTPNANANANGTDTFTYVASDGTTTSASTTVTITVTPVNDAPVINGGNAIDLTTSAPNGVVTGNLNVTDADGDPVTYTVNRSGTYGSLAIGDDGQLTYTPDDINAQLLALRLASSYPYSDGLSVPPPKPQGPADVFIITATDPSGASSSTEVDFFVPPYNGPGAAELSTLYYETIDPSRDVYTALGPLYVNGLLDPEDVIAILRATDPSDPRATELYAYADVLEQKDALEQQIITAHTTV